MIKVNGEYARGAGGSAFAVVSEDLNEVYHSDSQHFDNTTNNYCELYAIFMALKYYHENYSGRPVEIRSDSAYCVNMLKSNGWVYGWVKNGWTRGKKHIVEWNDQEQICKLTLLDCILFQGGCEADVKIENDKVVSMTITAFGIATK